MFTNNKFVQLMQEAEGDSMNFLDNKFLALREGSQADNDRKSLRSLLNQDPVTLHD